MAHGNRTPLDNKYLEWLDSRLPIITMMQKEYGVFPTPRRWGPPLTMPSSST